MDQRKRVIVTNIVFAYAIKACAVLVSFFLLPAYLSYFENATVLGVLFALFTVFSWISSLDGGLGVGLRNKLTSLFSQKDGKGKAALLSTTYSISFVFTLALLLLGALSALLLPFGKILGISADLIDGGTLAKTALILFAGASLSQFLKLSTSVLYATHHSALVDLFALLPNAAMLLVLKTAARASLSETLLKTAFWFSLFNVLPYAVLTVFLFAGPLRDCRPTPGAVERGDGRYLLTVGFPLFLSQTLFLIVSTANEVVVGRLTSPADVVTCQAYFKIFKLFFLAVSLTLTPIWSAVTEAKARGDYLWIEKAHKFYLGLAGFLSLTELLIVPFLPAIIRLWLGEDGFTPVTGDALIFALFGAVLMFHAVSSTFSAGLSSFRLQIALEGVAAVLFFTLSVVFVNKSGHFSGVILANALAHLPYEICVPIKNARKIRGEIPPA